MSQDDERDNELTRYVSRGRERHDKIQVSFKRNETGRVSCKILCTSETLYDEGFSHGMSHKTTRETTNIITTKQNEDERVIYLRTDVISTNEL